MVLFIYIKNKFFREEQSFRSPPPPNGACVVPNDVFLIVKASVPGQSVTLTMIFIVKRGRMATLLVVEREFNDVFHR
ncbi:hypothetical protein J2Z66_005056 [Paenibacillus eucommiae]|uniref:Uncharacterized protein n=1 Tax=Paenibacillus eucommiae TaxID=1355755 RepID=A0ABS4J3Q3_9BACL|nr:hypothetical protein [Paenibacillus eucommiae]